MNVKIEREKIIKPIYEGISPSTSLYVPFSVFDTVTYNTHIAIIYAFCPPTPTNATIEHGLQKTLSKYREFAGRIGENEESKLVIFLNDQGVKLVEATVDIEFAKIMPLRPSPTLFNFHPSLEGVEELMQVQLTRFTCGSLMVGFTAHHFVVDGNSVSNFLVAWGKACQGLDRSPLPIHDRTIFNRIKPNLMFEHRGREFESKNIIEDCLKVDHFNDDIIVHKIHFTSNFLQKLKAKAAPSNGTNNNKLYSSFVSLVAHLWRAITKARALGEMETTQIRISVNGRTRLNPPIPNEYFGNLVLWAFPTAKVKNLLRKPLPYAAMLVHDAIQSVNDNYIKSFIDFASHKVEKSDLVPTADMSKHFLCPNLEVDSWLRFPFYDIDFGGGSPFLFMPSYFPTEGMIFVVPSFLKDGSIDAYIPLFQDNLASFKNICYSLD